MKIKILSLSLILGSLFLVGACNRDWRGHHNHHGMNKDCGTNMGANCGTNRSDKEDCCCGPDSKKTNK